MSKKLSLLAAAVMFAFVFQTAMAADDGNDFDRNGPDQEFVCPAMGGMGMRMGRGMMMRQGRMDRGMRHGDRGMRGMRGWRGGCDSMGTRGMGMGRGFGFGMMRRLDLTPEQQKQIVDAMAENYRDRLLARIELGEAFEKLREARNTDPVNADAVIAANQAVGAATGKLDALSRTFADKIKPLLTPEQLKKAEAMRDGRRGDRGAWGGGRRMRDWDADAEDADGMDAGDDL